MNTELNSAMGPQQGLTTTLAKDLKVIASDTGTLLKDASCSALREISATRSALRERARNLAGATDEFARSRPWTVVGVAATAGLIIGALLSRR
jgi:ElaB/YqjD/DUF883 family membrane-anchored ribosome-binding protein